MAVFKSGRRIALERIDCPALSFIGSHEYRIASVASEIGLEVSLVRVFMKTVDK